MKLKDYSISELYSEIFSRKSNPIDFGSFLFHLNPNAGNGVYFSETVFHEFFDTFYMQLQKEFNPKIIFDIGANIGIYSCLFGRLFPESNVYSYEPNPSAFFLLKKNIEENNINNCHIFSKIMGDQINHRTFQVNKQFDVDSRCVGLDDFDEIIVNQTKIDKELSKRINSDFVFIKIDCQGYEPQIFDGGLEFFNSDTPFLIKLEFAPFWLLSQQNDPYKFLSYLIDNFKVVEHISYGFKEVPMKQRFNKCIKKSEIFEFVNYVQSKNRENKGHVDLLLASKNMF